MKIQGLEMRMIMKKASRSALRRRPTTAQKEPKKNFWTLRTVKFTPLQVMKAEGEKRQCSTLSLTTAIDGVAD